MTIADPPSLTLPSPLPPPAAVPPPPAEPEPMWEVAKLFPPKGQWTEGDYFHLDTNRMVELSDGCIEVLPMPTELHQDIAFLICALLRAFVRADAAAKVLMSPFAVRLYPGQMRQPDVMYMSGRNAHRRHGNHWDGADLAVEIVSDDDRRRDLEVKRHEYARASIPEYWIIDPRLRQVTVLRLNGEHYEPAGVYGLGATAASVVLPGFAVAVTDVFNAR